MNNFSHGQITKKKDNSKASFTWHRMKNIIYVLGYFSYISVLINKIWEKINKNDIPISSF